MSRINTVLGRHERHLYKLADSVTWRLHMQDRLLREHNTVPRYLRYQATRYERETLLAAHRVALHYLEMVGLDFERR